MSFGPPGGIPDKLGNIYEKQWCINQLIKLIDGKYDYVCWEPMGKDGVDVLVEYNSIKTYFQCKGRAGNSNHWTISRLKSEGVLKAVKVLLEKDKSCLYVFVSAISSIKLKDLCDNARRIPLVDEFWKSYVNISKEREKLVNEISLELEIDISDNQGKNDIFEYLKRIDFIQWAGDNESEESIRRYAKVLLSGDIDNVIPILNDYLELNLCKHIDISQICDFLQKKGYIIRSFESESIYPKIDRLKEQFRDSIYSGLINNKLILREQTESIKEILDSEDIVVVHGPAGIGKSSVLYELTKSFENEDILYLPVRLDRQLPEKNAIEFGKDLGLPESPVNCLEKIPSNQYRVLILDQLDALRWTSTHTITALEICKELVREAISRGSDSKVKVILSCRTFDLENDPLINSWLNSPNIKAKKISIGKLDDNIVAEILKIKSFDYHSLFNKQKEILKVPQQLAMWCEILDSQKHVNKFTSVSDLMRLFWEDRRRKVADAGIAVEDFNNLLNALVNFMDSNNSISAPVRLIEKSPKISDLMQTLGIIMISGTKVTFCHQNYLDYQIAQKILDIIDTEEDGILNWLGDIANQQLFKREQLKIGLQLLSEEKLVFEQSIKQIICSSSIRFHLKHLTLSVIGQVENPSHDLKLFVRNLLKNEYWSEHLIELVYRGHIEFTKDLINEGVIDEWLNSKNQVDINNALWMLKNIKIDESDLVFDVIKPYKSCGGEWPNRLLGVVEYDDSGDLFEIYVRAFEKCESQCWVHWDKLASKFPQNFIILLEIVLKKLINKPENMNKSVDYSEGIKHAKIDSKLIETYFNEIWESILPICINLSDEQIEDYFHSIDYRYYRGVWNVVCDLLLDSGTRIAFTNPDKFIEIIDESSRCDSTLFEYIIAKSMLGLGENNADMDIKWLIGDNEPRFNIGKNFTSLPWQPAMDIIDRFSHNCSDSIFIDLVNAIIEYKESGWLDRAKYYLESTRDGYYGYFWGEAQYHLLPKLDEQRINVLSPKVNGLIGVLKEKFRKYDDEYFKDFKGTKGGFVSSKIDGKLAILSDKSWLNILGNTKIGSRFSKCIYGSNSVQESSIHSYSSSLRTATSREPERFLKLALNSIFPLDINQDYISAIMQGVSNKKPENLPNELNEKWQQAPVDLIEQFFDKFAAEKIDALSFCRIIQDRSDEGWSTITLSKLKSIAINHPDPEKEQLHYGCDKKTSEVDAGHLLTDSLNCVRGVAAKAIANIINNYHTEDKVDFFGEAIDHLINDDHPSVLIVASNICLASIDICPERSIKWFITACNNDIRTSASYYARYYFNYATEKYSDRLITIVSRMIEDENSQIQLTGAEESFARWMFYNYYNDLVKQCIYGNLYQRIGLINIAKQFFNYPKYAKKCQAILKLFFSDVEAKVLEAYRDLFWYKTSLDNVSKEFIRDFVNSEAYKVNPEGLIYAFEDFDGILIKFADILIDICRKLTTDLCGEAQSPATSLTHDANKVVKVIIRLYEQAEAENNDEIRDKCLDMLDSLFENRIGYIGDILKTIDNN